MAKSLMKKQDVLKHFKDRVTDVAAACGISCASVSQWGEVIPEKNALKLDRITDGALRYDELYYSKTA